MANNRASLNELKAHLERIQHQLIEELRARLGEVVASADAAKAAVLEGKIGLQTLHRRVAALEAALREAGADIPE